MMDDLFIYAPSESSQRELGEQGMEQAYEHAERVSEGWQHEADQYVLIWCQMHRDPFLTEEVRIWAHEKGLATPPDPRAWGGVMNRAVKCGRIKRVGYSACKLSGHGRVMPLWQSLTHKGAAL